MLALAGLTLGAPTMTSYHTKRALLDASAGTCDKIDGQFIVTLKKNLVNGNAADDLHTSADGFPPPGNATSATQTWAGKYAQFESAKLDGAEGGGKDFFTLVGSLKRRPVAVVDASESVLEQILADDDVETVAQDCVITMGEPEISSPLESPAEEPSVEEDLDEEKAPGGRRLQQQAGATWGLDRIDPNGLDGTYSHGGANGKGIYVYVLDQPLSATVADFGGRVQAGFDASAQNAWVPAGEFHAGGIVPDGAFCGSHGTHVAGTVASSTYGVAKDATLVAVQVLGCGLNRGGRGSGSWGGVIAGVDWAADQIQNRGTPGILTMSLGGRAFPQLDDAVRDAAAAGAHVLVAGGNNPPGNVQNYSPARAGGPGSDVITVGAMDENGRFGRCAGGAANCYNYGAGLDILAPGVSITSWSNDGNVAAGWSGTSMATPHVTGVAALLLQAKPNLTPAELKAEILASATTPAINYAGLPANHGSTNRVLRIPPAALHPPSLQVSGSPAYAHRTVGEYLTTDEYYKGRPVYARTDQYGVKWRLYVRADAAPHGWVLDFNKADDTWSGTVRSALNSKDLDSWDAKWSGGDKMEVTLPRVCVTGSPAYGFDTKGAYELSKDVYDGMPIWKRKSHTWGSITWSLYQRKYNYWVLDFNGVDETWRGTVNYAKSQASTQIWDAKWAGRGGMQVGACPPRASLKCTNGYELKGKTYADCAGEYAKSSDMLNGKPIWDRKSGSRFMFYCGGRWRVTGSQWRAAFLKGKIRHCGAFISSEPLESLETEWYDAKWTKAKATTSCKPVARRQMQAVPEPEELVEEMAEGNINEEKQETEGAEATAF